MGLLWDVLGHAGQQGPGTVLGAARHPQLKLEGSLHMQLRSVKGCCL